MANSCDSWALPEIEEKWQNDREYLSEWPPVDEGIESEICAKRKRPKIDREERVGERIDNGCTKEPNAPEGERILWARPALARWWRRKQKEGDLRDSTGLPKSDNPNTLLRYVAR